VIWTAVHGRQWGGEWIMVCCKGSFQA